MALPCPFDISLAQPVFNGCPPDDSFLMFIAPSGSIPNGVGFIQWSTLKTCLLNNALRFAFLQFTIGQGGSPMNQGDSVLTIGVANIIQDSVFGFLGGIALVRNDNTQWSYTVVYTANNAVITFDSPVANGQQFMFIYAYSV